MTIDRATITERGNSKVIDEIEMYRIAGVTFLAGLPVAILLTILPARTQLRKRIRLAAAAFIGIGTCFMGFALSWPGPNSITDIMMLGGLVVFLASAFFFTRSFLAPGKLN
jgi:hypothetical protein